MVAGDAGDETHAIHVINVDTAPPTVTFVGNATKGYIMSDELFVTVEADEDVEF